MNESDGTMTSSPWAQPGRVQRQMEVPWCSSTSPTASGAPDLLAKCPLELADLRALRETQAGGDDLRAAGSLLCREMRA